jgi:hypothetical protein
MKAKSILPFLATLRASLAHAQQRARSRAWTLYRHACYNWALGVATRNTWNPTPVLALIHVIRDVAHTPTKGGVSQACRTVHKLLDNFGLRVFHYEPI